METTPADKKLTLQSLAEQFATHEESENLRHLEIQEQLKGLATKKDVAEMLNVFKAIKTAIQVTKTITSTGGSVTYHFTIALAAFIMALAIISGAIKGGLSNILAAAAHNFHP